MPFSPIFNASRPILLTKKSATLCTIAAGMTRLRSMSSALLPCFSASSTARPVTSPAPCIPACVAIAAALDALVITRLASVSINFLAAASPLSARTFSAASLTPFLSRDLPTTPVNAPGMEPTPAPAPAPTTAPTPINAKVSAMLPIPEPIW